MQHGTVNERPSGLYPVAVKIRLAPKAPRGLVRAAVSAYVGSAVQHGVVLIRVL
jgi:hypothetical protein